MANLDVLFIVASTTQPVPSTLVLDKLAASALYQNVQPVLVVTKTDLAAADMLRKAYTGSGLPLVLLHYDTGEGLDEVRGWIKGPPLCLLRQFWRGQEHPHQCTCTGS